MTLRSWDTTDLARAAGKNYKTIDRFLRGEVRTIKTADAIARAFGYEISRYFVRVEKVA